MANHSKDHGDKLRRKKELAHQRTDYTNAPGCKKLGIRNAKPILDAKTKECLVLGYDDEGPVVISREEALLLMDFLPSPEEIEKRKRECEFLFPHSHRDRVNRLKSGPYSIPQVFRYSGDVEHNRKKPRSS